MSNTTRSLKDRKSNKHKPAGAVKKLVKTAECPNEKDMVKPSEVISWGEGAMTPTTAYLSPNRQPEVLSSRQVNAMDSRGKISCDLDLSSKRQLSKRNSANQIEKDSNAEVDTTAKSKRLKQKT